MRHTSGDGGEGKSDRWEELLASFPQLLDQRQVEPQAFSLSRQVSSLLQSILQQLEIWSLEQSLGGSDGIRRIGDDDIVLVLVLGKELESITNVDSDSRVLVAFGHVGEPLLGYSDNGLLVSSCLAWRKTADLVNVDQGDFLNRLVFQGLSNNTSITTTNDQDRLGVRVRSDRDMSDHLLVPVDQLLPSSYKKGHTRTRLAQYTE